VVQVCHGEGVANHIGPEPCARAVVDRLSTEVAKIVHVPEVHARLLGFGIDPSGTTAAQANEITRTDMARWQAIIRDVSYINFE
jgi:tripartite-type tricarboxylate transporter receptor subunit TctC